MATCPDLITFGVDGLAAANVRSCICWLAPHNELTNNRCQPSIGRRQRGVSIRISVSLISNIIYFIQNNLNIEFESSEAHRSGNNMQRCPSVNSVITMLKTTPRSKLAIFSLDYATLHNPVQSTSGRTHPLRSGVLLANSGVTE